MTRRRATTLRSSEPAGVVCVGARQQHACEAGPGPSGGTGPRAVGEGFSAAPLSAPCDPADKPHTHPPTPRSFELINGGAPKIEGGPAMPGSIWLNSFVGGASNGEQLITPGQYADATGGRRVDAGYHTYTVDWQAREGVHAWWGWKGFCCGPRRPARGNHHPWLRASRWRRRGP
jgi:hypothetical protein